MSGKSRYQPPRKPAAGPRRKPPVVSMNPIPSQWAARLCAVDTCVAVATKTICGEPLVCEDETCRQLIACDDHADLLRRQVYQMLTQPPDRVEPVPPEGWFGGHD